MASIVWSSTRSVETHRVKGRDISLCGIQPDQTGANYFNGGLGSGDAVLLASHLSKAGVSASLTRVSQIWKFRKMRF